MNVFEELDDFFERNQFPYGLVMTDGIHPVLTGSTGPIGAIGATYTQPKPDVHIVIPSAVTEVDITDLLDTIKQCGNVTEIHLTHAQYNKLPLVHSFGSPAIFGITVAIRKDHP